MNKPRPKDFGYEPAGPSLGEEGGWVIEGGEEAYEIALEKWTKEHISYTPGPWVKSGQYVFPQSDTAENICYVSWGYKTKDEAAKNAELIAAAPEMLQALEMAAEYMGLYQMPPIGDLGKTILLAIKKAKGEQ